jgi:hypothetical protein
MGNAAPRDTIRRFLELLFAPGDVFEVRAPGCRDRPDTKYAYTCSGYFTFDTIDRAAGEIAALDHSAVAPGIYVTLNPVAPARWHGPRTGSSHAPAKPRKTRTLFAADGCWSTSIRRARLA